MCRAAPERKRVRLGVDCVCAGRSGSRCWCWRWRWCRGWCRRRCRCWRRRRSRRRTGHRSRYLSRRLRHGEVLIGNRQRSRSRALRVCRDSELDGTAAVAVGGRDDRDPESPAAGRPRTALDAVDPHGAGAAPLRELLVGRGDRELAGASFLAHSNTGVVDDDLGLALGELWIGSGVERHLPVALPRRRRQRRDPASLAGGGPPALLRRRDRHRAAASAGSDTRPGRQRHLTLYR